MSTKKVTCYICGRVNEVELEKETTICKYCHTAIKCVEEVPEEEDSNDVEETEEHIVDDLNEDVEE